MDSSGLTALLLAAVIASLVRSQSPYPESVWQERTDGFVARPNVLRGVETVIVTRSYVTPKAGEVFIAYSAQLDDRLKCVENASGGQAEWNRGLQPRLPGMFVCGQKRIFVIPRIRVEARRFFNVSLDFLRLADPASPELLTKKVPESASFKIAPSGIIFLSGSLTQEGEMNFAFNFAGRNNPRTPRYGLRVKLIVEAQAKPDLLLLIFKMTPKGDLVGFSNILRQILAVKCAAEVFDVSASDLHNVDMTNTDMILKVRLQPQRKHCDFNITEARTSCEHFVVENVVFDRRNCVEMAEKFEQMSRGSSDRPALSENNEPAFHSQEQEIVLNIDQDTFVPPLASSDEGSTAAAAATTRATISTEKPPSVTASSMIELPLPPAREPSEGAYQTSLPTATESTSPKLILDVEQDSATPDKSEAASPDPERQPPMPPTQTGIGVDTARASLEARNQQDPRLKSALYGLSGLAAFAVIIVFIIFFNKTALCKRKAGYDPVFVAQSGSFEESPKHPDATAFPKC